MSWVVRIGPNGIFDVPQYDFSEPQDDEPYGREMLKKAAEFDAWQEDYQAEQDRLQALEQDAAAARLRDLIQFSNPARKPEPFTEALYKQWEQAVQDLETVLGAKG